MTLDLNRIRAERVAKGMTQEEVDKKMDWKTRTPYAKRENGIVAIGADGLISLALIFGYTKDDLGIFFNQNVLEKEHVAS